MQTHERSSRAQTGTLADEARSHLQCKTLRRSGHEHLDESVALETQRDGHIDDGRRHPVVGNRDQVIEQLSFLTLANGTEVRNGLSNSLQPRPCAFDVR